MELRAVSVLPQHSPVWRAWSWRGWVGAHGAHGTVWAPAGAAVPPGRRRTERVLECCRAQCVHLVLADGGAGMEGSLSLS